MTCAEVDIVLPCHQGEVYAEQALRSLVAQTHQSWKAWIVDDGSSDESRRKLSGIVEKIADSRITLVFQGQKGASAARNAGIDMGVAPWVAFLDIDDFWAPEKLEAQLAIASYDERIVAVYCDYRIIRGEKIFESNVPPRLRGSIGPALLREGNCVSGSASACLVRRKTLEKAGPFDTSLRLGEDWDLWIRISELGGFDFVDSPLVYIRQNTMGVQESHRLSNNYADKTRELNAHIEIIGRYAQSMLPDGGQDKAAVDRLRREAERLAKHRLTRPEVRRLRSELQEKGSLGSTVSVALKPPHVLTAARRIILQILATTVARICRKGPP